MLAWLKVRWCCCDRMVQHEPRSTIQDREALEGHEVDIVPEPVCALVLESELWK